MEYAAHLRSGARHNRKGLRPTRAGDIRIGDFRRWYDEAAKPKTEAASRAFGRHTASSACSAAWSAYGVTAELPECARLAVILAPARFKQPGRRRIKLELEHVQAFVANAIELGRISLALGTALQFETTLRQRDVIGEWEPIPTAPMTIGHRLARSTVGAWPGLGRHLRRP